MFKKNLLVISIFVLFLLPTFAYAINIPGWPLVPCGLSQDNPATSINESKTCGRCDLFQLFKNIIDFVIGGLMPPLAVLLFVWAGFLILLSGANPGLYSQGQTIFKNTFYGIVVLLSAWMITNSLILSIGAKYNNAGNWWQFSCTEPAPVQPPTVSPPPQKYSCNQNNQCVADSSGPYATSNCNGQCAPPPGGSLSIVTVNLANGTVGQPYDQTIQVTGGVAPYGWAMTGSPPPGLTFDTATGNISGIPTATGTFNFDIEVVDQSSPSQSVTKQMSISITTQTSEVTCLQSGLNLCQGQQASCSASACGQYVSAINQYASRTGVSNGVNLLKAIMFQESSCVANRTSFDGSSFGLMQFQPATANIYKSRCGISVNIDSAWLLDPANANLSICLAAEFIGAIVQSQCGSSVRNIAAGYNGGQAGDTSACGPSVDCASELSCSNEPVKRWECLYDDPQHQTCNGGNDPVSGYNETRNYATKVLYCYNNPGF